MDIRSGPDALWGLRSFNSVCTPSAVTLMLGMVGAWLGPFDVFTGVSSFVNTEQYCVLRIFAFPTASAIRTPSDLNGETEQEAFFLDFT